MHRKIRTDAELAALSEQCLDIRVQLSVLMDRQPHQPTTVAALLNELAALEARIRNRKDYAIG